MTQQALRKLEQYQPSMQSLTNSLLDYTDIDFFEYQTIYPDCSGLYLSSHPELSIACIEQNIQSSYQRLVSIYQQKKDINSLHNIFYFLPKEDNTKANQLIKDFGYSNTFIIIDYLDNAIQSFVFSSARTEDLTRFCFTHFDAIIQFKNHFKRQASQLIQQAQQHRIPLCANENSTKDEPLAMPFNKKQFMQATKPTHYYIKHKGKEIEVTAQEFKVLKCLSQGRANKEAGLLLGISPNTLVNYHLSLKQKFDVSHRSALIDIYLASDLIVL